MAKVSELELSRSGNRKVSWNSLRAGQPESELLELSSFGQPESGLELSRSGNRKVSWNSLVRATGK